MTAARAVCLSVAVAFAEAFQPGNSGVVEQHLRGPRGSARRVDKRLLSELCRNFEPAIYDQTLG